jgi:signal transduction histidine kinase
MGEEPGRTQPAAEFLAEAGLALAGSLDHAETLSRVAALAVPRLADWCVIDLVEQGDIHRIAEPEAVAALNAGKPRLTLALEARSRSLGSLTLVARTPDRYRAEEKALAGELARRAALAIDSARLYREARQAVQARDEFLSVASHELNTPLAALSLTLQELAESAQREPLDLPMVARTAVLAERQGRRLTRLIGDMLDVTRLQRNALVLRLESLELGRHVREVVKGFQPRLASAGCEVKLELDTPVVGRWDAARIEQVLLNLLSNATKFGAGSPIEIRVDQAGDTARLAVIDHGVGIDPARRARLFERFESSAPAQQYGGLGLGLYISRHIVEAHGGSISVESEPGQGATFLVSLPCAGPQGHPARAAPR